MYRKMDDIITTHFQAKFCPVLMQNDCFQSVCKCKHKNFNIAIKYINGLFQILSFKQFSDHVCCGKRISMFQLHEIFTY